MRTDRLVQARDCEDAYFAVNQFTTWINNADAKAGFLSAALAILADGLVRESNGHFKDLRHLSFRQWCATTTIALSVLFSIISAVYLIRAIYPRFQSQSFSRYSWPSVARASYENLLKTDRRHSRDEAWMTAL